MRWPTHCQCCVVVELKQNYNICISKLILLPLLIILVKPKRFTAFIWSLVALYRTRTPFGSFGNNYKFCCCRIKWNEKCNLELKASASFKIIFVQIVWKLQKKNEFHFTLKRKVNFFKDSNGAMHFHLYFFNSSTGINILSNTTMLVKWNSFVEIYLWHLRFRKISRKSNEVYLYNYI